jgi:hypothetical protein
MHRIDHEYQITKMSEYKRTIPMSELLSRERMRVGLPAPAQSHPRPAKSPTPTPGQKWEFETAADASVSDKNAADPGNAVQPVPKAPVSGANQPGSGANGPIIGDVIRDAVEDGRTQDVDEME